MRTPDQVLAIITAATQWLPHADDYAAECFLQGERVTHVVQRQELHAVDPRLPVVFDVLRTYSHDRYATPLFGGSLVVATLDHWTAPGQIVLDDGRVLPTGAWAEFTVEPGADTAQVSFPYRSLLMHRDEQGQTIPIVTRTFIANGYVAHTWLDQQYPDWKNRYTTATELGLTGAARAAYVEARLKAPPTIALPDLIID